MEKFWDYDPKYLEIIHRNIPESNKLAKKYRRCQVWPFCGVTRPLRCHHTF